jgi:diadenosine tetraphosphatase ApaH/serine/threonine PP2A family protein phosphatase
VAWTKKQITDQELLMYLSNLKAARLENDILYVHGSAEDPLMEYVREAEDREDFERFVEDIKRSFKRFDLCFTGHNHRAFLGTDEGMIFPHPGVTRFNVRDAKLYVCVGAVGQPRDEDWRASYVIYDGETVEYRRVAYDVEATARRIREAGLHEFLAERLFVGQ